VIEGAEVWLLADSVDLGHVVATGETVEIETNGTFPLVDGHHSITAVQVLRDQEVSVGNLHDQVDLFSADSAPLDLLVDTQAPEFTSDPITEGVEGHLYRYDADVTGEATDQVLYELLEAPEGMVLADAAEGLIEWTPDYDQSGVHDVLLQATDSAGNRSTQQFQVTIDDAPEVAPVDPQQVIEGETVRFTVTAQSDRGPVEFRLGDGAPQGAVIDPVTGEFSWTPGEEHGPGEYSIEVQAVDTAGRTGSQTVRITVTEYNLPPELAAVDDLLVNEGDLVEIALQATDPDLPAQELVFELLGQVPDGMTIDPQTGLIQWQPGEAQGPGQYMITVRVTDWHGASDETSFTVEVAEVDRAPKIDPVADQLLVPGELLELTARAIDPDIPASQIRYQLLDGPEGMTIDEQSGLLRWEVPADFVGRNALERTVLVTVSATEIADDGAAGSSVTVTFSVRVVDVRAVAATVFGPLERDQQARAESFQPAAEQTVEVGLSAQLAALAARGSAARAAVGRGGHWLQPPDVRQLFHGMVQLDRFGLVIRPTSGMAGQNWRQPLSAGGGGQEQSGQSTERSSRQNREELPPAVLPPARRATEVEPPSDLQHHLAPVRQHQPGGLPPEAADEVIVAFSEQAAEVSSDSQERSATTGETAGLADRPSSEVAATGDFPGNGQDEDVAQG